MRALLLTALLALSPGCLIDIDYDDTRFRCQEKSRCPDGYECVSGMCEKAGGDAGVPLDGAATADAPPEEGAVDGGTNSGP